NVRPLALGRLGVGHTSPTAADAPRLEVFRRLHDRPMFGAAVHMDARRARFVRHRRRLPRPGLPGLDAASWSGVNSGGGEGCPSFRPNFSASRSGDGLVPVVLITMTFPFVSA